MQPKNLFIDTSVILDTIFKNDLYNHRCSGILLDLIRNGTYKGWTADYTLCEMLGRMKEKLEAKKQIAYDLKNRLTAQDIAPIIRAVEELRNIPNFEVFKTTKITQEDIYNVVKETCVQAKDALVLLSAIEAGNKLKEITLVTWDGRLLYRGRSKISTAHPSTLISCCPRDCGSIASCKFRKRN